MGIQAAGTTTETGPGESRGIEIEDSRDDLEVALRHLPEGARADLGRLMERIDMEFERRTLPDPGRTSGWTAGHPRRWRIRPGPEGIPGFTTTLLHTVPDFLHVRPYLQS